MMNIQRIIHIFVISKQYHIKYNFEYGKERICIQRNET